MLWDFIQWLQQTNLPAATVAAVVPEKNANNLILLLYIATLTRSYLFGATFFVSAVLTAANFFGQIGNPDINSPDYLQQLTNYNVMYYSVLAVIFNFTTCLYCQRNRNRSVIFWCVTMLILLGVMIIDGAINADRETFIWRHYDSIVVCIHCCLILSFYRPVAVVNRLVDSIRRLLAQSHSVNAMRYLLYTVRQ